MATRRCLCGHILPASMNRCRFCGRNYMPMLPTPYIQPRHRQEVHIQNYYMPGSHVQNVYGPGSNVQNIYGPNSYAQNVYQPDTYVPARPTYYRPTPNGYGYSRGNTGGCVLGLLIIIAFVLFALSRTSSYSSANSTQNDSAVDMAKTTVQNYYDSINNKNYRTAYEIWQSNVDGSGDSYSHFVNGYSNTIHDDISFNNTILHDDGSVSVSITIQAQETEGTRTYYIQYVVAKVGGIWKFISGG